MDARTFDNGPLLTIMIATLEQRRHLFERVHSKLSRQVEHNGLSDKVEILVERDSGDIPIGSKRNLLLDRARGLFVVTVDDDDDVHDEYVPLIMKTIYENPHIDCIGITCEMTFNGRRHREIVLSARYKIYRTENGRHLRPPHHINPIRRSIAQRFRFEDVRHSEDADWALQISRSGALTSEVFLDEPLYLYRSRRNWYYRVFLDCTEFIRHPLRLQAVNGIRLKRWMRNLGNV